MSTFPITLINVSMSDVQLSWNLGTSIQQLFAYHFMQTAFLAGTLIALIAGSVGYFMVLRGQSFIGHTLANVGFAGAAGATLIGWSPVLGLLVFSAAGAIGISLLGGRYKHTQLGQGVAIGTVQTFTLSLGLLFVHLSSSSNASLVYTILFGAVLGISDRDVSVIALTTLVTLAGLMAIARPLLFASIDPDVALSRGVPVLLLDNIFLVLLAFAVAQSVQVVGVLLIFALLVTPAAIAQQLTSNPAVTVGLSISLAVLFTWAGLAIAYYTPYPVGFFITSLAFATYALVRLFKLVRRIVLRI
ncbi:metal ABC transporter permease [Aetokthonos hydrillicola Thurmond2011]|uniref:Metal ABC transporter permease n=1 Tax=Aetokthonos hydrillicola Thurmond2011 TaxID=2712845 RepID=A0AAP5IC80_9CYAN|nr:metal ABC transporter permease [Aetokthonos hydrillicola]MDR9898484.1 metal ABC transporter permease [Aetokthonos hydrillicola Thurmond2011]